MKTSVKKNYIYNLIYNIVTICFPIIITPYVARVLNPKDIGAYQYTNAIVSIFILVASLGTSMYAQKEIASKEKKEDISKIFYSILYIRIFMTIIVSILYFLLIIIDQKYKLLYIIQFISIIANGANIIWLFQGMEDFKKTATRGISIKIFSMICIFLLVKKENDLLWYCLISALSDLLGTIILWFYVKKIIIKVRVNLYDIKKHIKPIILLFLPVAAIYVYTYVDRIVLGVLSDKTQVGYYSQSERIVKILMTIVTSLGVVMLPRMSKLIIKKDWNAINKNVTKSIKFIILLGLPMVIGIICVSDIFIPWFLGNKYLECKELLKILSPLILIIGLSSVTGQAILIPLNKQKEYTFTIILGAVLNVIVNIILIPKYGAIGAAIATILAELIVNITQQFLVFRMLRIKFILILKDNFKIIISSIFMLFVLIFLKNFFVSSFISIMIYSIIGSIVYFLLLIILKENIVIDFVKLILCKFKIIKN